MNSLFHRFWGVSSLLKERLKIEVLKLSGIGSTAKSFRKLPTPEFKNPCLKKKGVILKIPDRPGISEWALFRQEREGTTTDSYFGSIS